MRWLRPVKPIIPLDRDASGRTLPFIIAGLTVLATLMLLLTLALGQGVSGWQTQLAGKVTVQILPLESGAAPLEQRVETALALLRGADVVAAAEPIAADKMAALLAPWLGQGALPDDLPMPALIDVTLKAEGADTSGLRSALQAVPGAQLDDHGSWMQQVRQLAWLGLAMAAFLLVLIVGATLLMLVLLVQAAMEAHHEVIELLHLVGATDAFIAKQLRGHMLALSLQGALLGGLVAALLLLVLDHYASRTGLQVPLSWLWLPVMPLVLVALSVLTAQRVAVRRLAELP
jgi:cell division transport system permease protein